MTPKEKAEELVGKFNLLCAKNKGWLRPSESDKAKKCAIISVDEILESNPCCEDSDRGGNFQWASNEYYWQQVKQEIQSL